MDIQHLRADYLLNTFFSSNSHPVNSPIIEIAITTFITILSVIFLILLIRKILSIKQSLTEPSILIELTPPASTEKTAYTTQQLFSVIHTLGKQLTFIEKIQGKKNLFSFEIVSTQDAGIRYVIRTTEKHASNLKRSIMSYLPFVQVKEVDEYLFNDTNNYSKVIKFNTTKHFAYPLKRQDTLEEHDPVAYITGMMTKLAPGELISLQLVLSPTQTNKTALIKQKIIRGEDVLGYLDSANSSPYITVLTLPITLLTTALRACAWAISTVVNDVVDARTAQRQAQVHFATQYYVQTQQKPARSITSFEQEIISSIGQKIDQPLFETSLRVFVSVKKKSYLQERLNGFTSSLGILSVPGYQSLRKKNYPSLNIINNYNFLSFKKRSFGLVSNRSSMTLSVSEASDLYHFPFTTITQTENIVKVHSKELPAPLSLKKTAKLDVEFAKNTYGGTTTMIGLTADERRRHMYIIGATGTGKSTLLLSIIAQDIQNGKGVAVVDPHGELAETVLSFIPKDRIKDVIYFNPDDLKYPIGLNLLELTPNLDEEDTLREKEFIAESVISLFRKVFSDAMVGNPHRIEYILRNTIHTAFTVENRTLFTIFELLNNPIFQKKVVGNLKDENLKNFWKHEFGKAGDFQKVKMISPITSRIGRFLFSPSAKRILEQTTSTVNFDNIMDSGKILVCNLSKGKLGEDTSQVLGIMILNKIQLASLKRARVKSSERRDFYLYVDEFQNFATKSFIDILSESRKYKLNLTMAEQSTSQLRDKHLVHTILANAGTIISFKTANPEDEKLLLPQFHPYIEQGEIANLPAFHFYMKISAINPEEPFSGETMLLDTPSNSKNNDLIIESSRKNFAGIYDPKQKKDIEGSGNAQEEKAEEMKVSSGLPA